MVTREVRDFGGIRFDTTRFPVVVTRFPEHPVQDADLAAMLAALEQVLSSGARSFQITDLSRIGAMAPASQRKLSGEWTTRTYALQKRASVGGCLVITSALVRGLVTAIHWLKEPPNPVTTVATFEEAWRVAESALERAGLELPARVG